MSNNYSEISSIRLTSLVTLIVLSISFGSQAYAENRPEQAAVEAYAKDIGSRSLDFSCGKAVYLGAFISGGQIPNDEELAYAVSEGFCAGYITAVSQMLHNIEAGHIDPAIVDQICAENSRQHFYRSVADQLPNVDGVWFTGERLA